jgi:hypothetical protein
MYIVSVILALLFKPQYQQPLSNPFLLHSLTSNAFSNIPFNQSFHPYTHLLQVNEPASDALSIYLVYRTHSFHSGHNADADNGSLLARENASSNDVPDLPFF